MALQRQNIPLPLAQGADTKTDDFVLPPGKLTVAQNVFLTASGTVRKRPGHVSLGNLTTLGTAMGAGQGMAAYQGELVVEDTNNLYSYSAAQQGFLKKGGFYSCSVTQDQVFRAGGSHLSASFVDSVTNTATGLQLTTYIIQGVGGFYTLVDTATGQVLANGVNIDGAASVVAAKPMAIGTFLVIIYNDTTNQRLKMLPFVGSAPQTVIDIASTTFKSTVGFFDACVLPSPTGGDPLLVVAWNTTDVGGGVAARAFRGSTLGGFGSSLSLVTGQPASNGLCIFPDTVFLTASQTFAQRLIIAYGNATQVRMVSCTATMTAGGGITDQLVNSPAGGPSIVTGISTSKNDTSSFRLFWSTLITGDHRGDSSFVAIATSPVNGAPSLTFNGGYLSGVSFVAKPFIVNGQVFTIFAYDPDNTTSGYTGQQPTYFVGTDGLVWVARLLYGNGGGRRNNGILAEVTQVAPGQFTVALQQRDLLTTVTASPNLGAPVAQGSVPSYVYTLTGVTLATLNFFDQQKSYFHATLSDTLHISGGLLQMYDGAQVVEHGFNLYPEGGTVTTSTTGGSLSAGVYTYYMVYEWTDNQGRLHRSAPSPGIQVTTTTNTSSASITFPNLQLTLKNNVALVVYRTQVNNIVPYRLGTPTQDSVNIKGGTVSQTIPDTTSDQNLSTGTPLYVLGSVAENLPLGPCTGLAVYKNRLCAITSDAPLSVWFSKPVQSASTGASSPAVEFNDSFYIPVDPRGGDSLTAIAVLDDKLILFKENRILFTSGDGPDSTGQNGTFADPAVITVDCGCVDPRSVVEMPNGLMFRGHKGIYLLDRGLRVTYIGARAENILDGHRVVSATLSPNIQQVKFGLDDGQTVLVYDYLNDQWTWNTNPELNSVAATIFQNLYTFLQPAGVVGQESLTSFTDFGNFIPMAVETGWLNLAELNGFQRIYALELLGRYKSAHILRVSAAYDNIETYTASGDLVSADQGTWGGPQTPTWGGTPPTLWGGPDATIIARFDLATQKCRTLKFRIEDFPLAGTYGESAQLTGFTLSVGVKAGLGKLADVLKVGVK